jgi:hypothetical protein
MDVLLFAITILAQHAAGAPGAIAVENGRGLVVVDFSWRRFQQNPNALNPPFRDEWDELGVKGQRGTRAMRVRGAPVRGFAYEMRLRNQGAKAIKALFWEFQFGDPSSPLGISRRQFGCRGRMKRGEVKELAVFSASPPTHVISAEPAGDGTEAAVATKVLINRVEYADGTVWQRTDWSPPRTSPYPADLFPDRRFKGKCIGF